MFVFSKVIDQIKANSDTVMRYKSVETATHCDMVSASPPKFLAKATPDA